MNFDEKLPKVVGVRSLETRGHDNTPILRNTPKGNGTARHPVITLRGTRRFAGSLHWFPWGKPLVSYRETTGFLPRNRWFPAGEPGDSLILSCG